MTAATGPPPSMADDAEELTPMLAQYFELCEAYEDALLLFQVGDFYEAFCEAAEEVARTCEVTLTQREDSTGTYPMAGIPIDNAATYVEPLLEAGYRVAIADQVEDPDETSGLVDRAVTRIVTPGTVVDDELLDPAAPTYVACVTAGRADTGGAERGEADSGDGTDSGTVHALAVVDVSTGECRATSADPGRIAEELERLGPAELLTGPDTEVDLSGCTIDPMRTDYDPDAFAAERARERVAAYLPAPDAVLETDAEVRACGAVLAYAEYTQGDDGPLEYVSRITRYDPRTYMRLDATAQRGLELFEARGARAGEEATLLSVLDETACAMGRRRLADWLRRPLLDPAEIAARHDAVGELAGRSLVREDLHERLREAYDLERLIGRASRGRANARDLRALLATLRVVPDLKELLSDAECDRLRELRDGLDELADVRELIDRAIRSDPPQEVTEGGVIREGFDGELDDLRTTEREGREWVADLEARERERTGIDSLEVGYNQVHGYYIEVTNPNLDRVPDDYTRRQTLKNAERFYTPELKRREDEILGAAERADALEYELFRDVRDRVAEEADRAGALARRLAELDALVSLASVAVENDYVRPEMGADGIEIDAGRHPVVERTRAEFVPNDADLTDARLAVITGPNMSGKSTYMRQVALICVLAQVGSFVPAGAARLPILDRVFTRVGASDDIAGGQSTFMREMSELTDILHAATGDSLVLLDEVGRGTSTADGLAIARATTEFLHDEVGATTLFATHYHDLTAVAEDLPDAVNLHFRVSRDGEGVDGERDDGDSGGEGSDGAGARAGAGAGTRDEGVTFLHRVAEGASSSSYGVEVARLAGVPAPVVARSRELVARSDGARSDGEPEGGADDSPGADASTGDDASDGAGSTDAEPTGAVPETNGSASLDSFVGAARENGDRPAPDGTDPETGPGAGREVGAETENGGEERTATSEAATVLDELRALDLARTTPVEALNALHDLQRRLEGGER